MTLRMACFKGDDVAHTGPICITAGDKRLINADAVNRLIEVVKAGRAAAAHEQHVCVLNASKGCTSGGNAVTNGSTP